MEQVESLACPHDAKPVLPARLRTRTGLVTDIDVLDVSLAGCMLERRALSLQEGERVLVRLADLAFMPAKVVWVDDTNAGLMFEQDLYEPVLDHLKRSFVKPS